MYYSCYIFFSDSGFAAVFLFFLQYKRDAVEAAVREIAQDREAFAEGRREALKRIGDSPPPSHAYCTPRVKRGYVVIL